MIWRIPRNTVQMNDDTCTVKFLLIFPLFFKKL